MNIDTLRGKAMIKVQSPSLDKRRTDKSTVLELSADKLLLVEADGLNLFLRTLNLALILPAVPATHKGKTSKGIS